jgi:hypothetical protein
MLPSVSRAHSRWRPRRDARTFVAAIEICSRRTSIPRAWPRSSSSRAG